MGTRTCLLRGGGGRGAGHCLSGGGSRGGGEGGPGGSPPPLPPAEMKIKAAPWGVRHPALLGDIKSSVS